MYVHLLYGDVLRAFQQVIDVYDIKAVFFNEDQVGIGQKRDHQVTAFLEKKGIHVSKWQDTHLHGAQDILKGMALIIKCLLHTINHGESKRSSL